MARLQLTISDDLSERLDELKKFEKGAFCELAIREALKNPNITSRFIWKSTSATENKLTTEEVKPATKPMISIDDDFTG
jgi:hypothetical protein